jgi:putative ABC transport system ATP-binding protein
VGDEPTGNLDTVSAALVFQLFEELVSHGKTIVMVTHDRDLAGQVPRVVEVRDGTILGADEVDKRLVGDRQ